MESYKDDELFMRKDKSSFPAEFYSTPLMYEDDKIMGSVVVFLDITYRKNYEENLIKAKEEAELVNRTKSEFLANISHEIRTPMNSIMGLTDLLLSSEINNEQRENLEIILQSANDLLSIINDILDFSKIESGKLELSNVDFNFEELINKTIKTLVLKAHQKNIELILDEDIDIANWLVGDSLRLHQILINLIGNSIKFTEKGQVIVKIESPLKSSDYIKLHFSVIDSGIGIPEEKINSIFHSFTQVDGSITRKYGGTGLGLAITKKIIEMMNGKIWVESKPNEGSIFQFELVF